jgi:hypothetical protein
MTENPRATNVMVAEDDKVENGDCRRLPPSQSQTVPHLLNMAADLAAAGVTGLIQNSRPRG